MAIGYTIQLRKTTFQKILIQRSLLRRKISGGCFIGRYMSRFTVFTERKWIKPNFIISAGKMCGQFCTKQFGV